MKDDNKQKDNNAKEKREHPFWFDSLTIIIIVVLAYLGWCAYLEHKTADSKVHITNSKITIEKSEDSSRYIVLNYENGKVTNDILASRVRDDKENKKVVCECAETGDIYIFAYPVSITDVTYTKDYIKWSKSQH